MDMMNIAKIIIALINGETLMSEKIQLWCTFLDFSCYKIIPLDHHFSNQYNFFSIDHLLLVKRYVRHKTILTKLRKTFLTLSVFYQNFIFC